MDSLDASVFGLVPLTSGQELEPNKRYFADRNCNSFSLPSRANLIAGDYFEIHRTLEPKDIKVDFSEGLLFVTAYIVDGMTPSNTVHESYYMWPVSFGSIGFTTLKLYFNGLDFQTEDTTGGLSDLAVRDNQSTFTISGNFTVPVGVSLLKVTVVGGGGGGGGGATSIQTVNIPLCAQSGSGGGGGAAVFDSYVTVTAGDVIPVQVGAGGLSGAGGAWVSDPTGTTNATYAGSNGGGGGSSSFGSYITCSGGNGGIGGNATTVDNTILPSLVGGTGGAVTIGGGLGTPFDGGKGGNSGVAHATHSGINVATSGEDGESVNGFVGGKGALITLDRDGGAGGGGSSASASGGNASAASGQSGGLYGAGGAGGSGTSFNSGTGGGGSGGNGANGYVFIEWSL